MGCQLVVGSFHALLFFASSDFDSMFASVVSFPFLFSLVHSSSEMITVSATRRQREGAISSRGLGIALRFIPIAATSMQSVKSHEMMVHLKKSEYVNGDSNHFKLVGRSLLRLRNTFLQRSGTVQVIAPSTAAATPQTLAHVCVGILSHASEQR